MRDLTPTLRRRGLLLAFAALPWRNAAAQPVFPGKPITLIVPFAPGGVAEVARDAGCTMAQLALAWLLTRGEHVIPIPGTTNIAHLEENLGAEAVALSAAQVARLDRLVNHDTVQGARYGAQSQVEVDTEEF